MSILAPSGGDPCNHLGEDTMRYMISWFERPQGSPVEYENAQTRMDRA
jgi:hypothetical protein